MTGCARPERLAGAASWTENRRGKKKKRSLCCTHRAGLKDTFDGCSSKERSVGAEVRTSERGVSGLVLTTIPNTAFIWLSCSSPFSILRAPSSIPVHTVQQCPRRCLQPLWQAGRPPTPPFSQRYQLYRTITPVAKKTGGCVLVPFDFRMTATRIKDLLPPLSAQPSSPLSSALEQEKGKVHHMRARAANQRALTVPYTSCNGTRT